MVISGIVRVSCESADGTPFADAFLGAGVILLRNRLDTLLTPKQCPAEWLCLQPQSDTPVYAPLDNGNDHI